MNVLVMGNEKVVGMLVDCDLERQLNLVFAEAHAENEEFAQVFKNTQVNKVYPEIFEKNSGDAEIQIKGCTVPYFMRKDITAESVVNLRKNMIERIKESFSNCCDHEISIEIRI